MIKRIADAYKRFRHTHGYGVHSPFAYSLVKGVLDIGSSYAYYAESNLGREARDADSRRTAVILHRLACALEIKDAWVSTRSVPALYRSALRSANKEMVFSDSLDALNGKRMVVSAKAEIPLEQLCSHLAVPGSCLLLLEYPRSWSSKIFENLGEGLMFEGKRNLLVISRKYMQKVRYTVRL